MTTRLKKARRVCRIAFLVLILYGPALPTTGAPQGYLTPQDPPKARYVIDARVDPAGGRLDGREIVTFRNTARLPIEVIAVVWPTGPDSQISVSASGKTLSRLNPEPGPTSDGPLLFRLPGPAAPGRAVKLDISFGGPVKLDPDSGSLVTGRFYPALYWDGLPSHDAFSVKLDVPPGYALAASGRLDTKKGRYETPGARTFGLFVGKGMKAESREVEGVLVTAIATERGSKAAAVCLDTACDVIRFAKAWLGFYPFASLTIVPGGPGRWGGYPVATGIVAVHGQETYKDGESPLWWKWITAHEIGHQYWGEWVLDADDPAWLWIAMGIALDTEYLMTRRIDPDRRAKWMGNYLNGVRSGYDLTVDIPPAQVERIPYDRNNTVIHSKCPSIIFALDSTLGRPAFERITKRCLREFGRRRLGWREFERVCEQETGQNLSWFFEQWVRSNAYLCYKVTGTDSRPDGPGFRSTVTVRRLGTMKMPIPVKAVFEDGSAVTQSTERGLDTSILIFRSQARLKEAVLDPGKKLAMLDEPPPIPPEKDR